MNSTLKKIGSILTIIVFLPVIIVLTIEITNLTEDEKRIGEIYENQLQTILFSLNQYSEDFISSWRSQISSSFFQTDEMDKKNADLFYKLLSENKAIEGLFIHRLEENDNLNYYGIGPEKNSDKIINQYLKLIDSSEVRIKKLQKLEEAGYNKIDPFGEILQPGKSLLISVLNDNYICGLSVNSGRFIKDNLSQQIQQVTQENFVIACSKSNSQEIIYSTDQFNFETENLSLALWLLPEYNISIQLKGQTIQSLAKNRLINNIFVLIVLTVILLFGLFFVFRIIKKEVELAQIKSDFVSNVSHELRTPLALITMYSETLEMGRINSEEKRREYYKIISSEANRLSRIVNSILNFSKIEAGKRKYTFEIIVINSIVEGALSTYEHQLKNEGFEYNFYAGENIPEFSADKEALTEAIINLIDNAMKYSDNKKRIEIITGFEKDQIFIEVKDYGIGISNSDQTKIFDKFFRVTSGYVHNTKGTGLGLSLVMHIVEAHKGKITLNSKLGEGSSFRLNFPK
jgi:two-component system phosphate regulon sensor histidine kinase PhoR